MPLVMQQDWLGRRVTVRRVVAEGPSGAPRYGDVVGDLVALDDDTAVVETRRGPVTVPRERVAIARLAAPSTADELALEATAAQGWRASDTGAVGGWLLRAAAGFTHRANSVLPLRSPGLPLDEALGEAAQWYAARGLPLRLQIPTDARRLLDAELDQRGWPASPDVQVLAARLDMLVAPAAAAHPPAVHIDDEPDAAWLARYRGGDVPADVARSLLTAHPAVAFARVGRGTGTLAIGRGTVDEGWLGITAVEVSPPARRQGLARAIMAALWDWGRARGARRSYLQVGGDNAAALALYRRLGYWRHHDYRYRSAPD